VGKLQGVVEEERPNGRFRVALVEDEGEKPNHGKTTWAVYLHEHLSRQWEELQPREGERIAVIHHGLRRVGEGKLYRHYTLLSERTDAVPAEEIDASDLFNE
jgi:hypothetical protein